MRCTTCGQAISETCSWNQGRCPHLPSLTEQIINDPYKARFLNLLKFFKIIK
jgi:hypothetical protein